MLKVPNIIAYSTVTDWIWIAPLVKTQSPVLNSQWNSNPTNSFIKKNTQNDNRLFIFLSIIFTIENGAVTERYHNGGIRLE